MRYRFTYQLNGRDRSELFDLTTSEVVIRALLATVGDFHVDRVLHIER